MATNRIAVLVCIFFSVTLISCVEGGSTSDDFLLTGVSVGRIKLGTSKQQVLKLYRDHRVEEVDLFLEGEPGTPALQIYKEKELLLTAELFNGAVYRIRTTSPKFATRQGLKVGSTFGEAKQHYSVPKYVSGGEGGIYAVFDLKPGTLSLLLDVKPHPLSEYVTDQSKIVMIVIVETPKQLQKAK